MTGANISRQLRMLLAILTIALPLHLRSVQVTTTDDSVPGSLRQVINDAPGGSTVTFAPQLSGQTLDLTNGLIAITRSVTIDASALPGGVIIHGRGRNSLFHCGSQTTNTFIGLTLTGGRVTVAGGGAILNDSVLTINRCTFTNNTANEGGAIFNFATLTINNSTLVGNHARSGGAMEGDGGPITLNHCTLAGNVATNDGGAILNFFNLTLNHCTIVSNQAFSAGGINNEGTGTLFLNNSIVAGNTATFEPQIAGTIDFSTGVNLTSGNPMLVPLGDHGGPTPTMPPLPGSPAIDPVGGRTNSPFSTDQRGYPRRSGARVDIGAVEVQQADTANPPVLNQPARLPNGSLQLTFTNDPAIAFSMYASTNVAAPSNQWIRLGSTTQPSPGQYQYTDASATNHPKRFYKVGSP